MKRIPRPIAATIDLGPRPRKSALALRAHADLKAAWGRRPVDGRARMPRKLLKGDPRGVLAAYIAAHPAFRKAVEVRLTLTYRGAR